MAILAEKTYLGDVLKLETGEQQLFSRDKVTLISGQANLKTGTVLGKIALTSATLTETHAGNTGNGVFTGDVTTPVLANADLGVYKIVYLTATTFRVFSPAGAEIGEGSNTVAFSNRIKFTISTGGTGFVAGDTFLVTVAAGSLKVTQLAVAAVDGSQNAVGVLAFDTDATAADTATVMIARSAVLAANKIIWPAGITAAQQAAATVQLAALGIILRTGV